MLFYCKQPLKREQALHIAEMSRSNRSCYPGRAHQPNRWLWSIPLWPHQHLWLSHEGCEGVTRDILVCWLCHLLLAHKFCLILFWTCVSPATPASYGSTLWRLTPRCANKCFIFSILNQSPTSLECYLLLIWQALLTDSSVLALTAALMEPVLWLQVPMDIFSRNHRPLLPKAYKLGEFCIVFLNFTLNPSYAAL